MLLDAVRDDSPASKAGLKAGDKIVKLAGREIKNVYDYTYALGEMKPDQEYEIEVTRGAERLILKLTPKTQRKPNNATAWGAPSQTATLPGAKTPLHHYFIAL